MRFKDNNYGVSPVVGVVLLVAITVLLTVVVGVFVLDLGQNTNQSANAGIQTSEPVTNKTSITLIDSGSAVEVYVINNSSNTTISTGESVTVSGEWVVIGKTKDGSKTAIRKSSNWSGDLDTTNTNTGATVVVKSLPQTINSPSGFDDFTFDNSTYVTDSGYPSIYRNSNDSVIYSYTTHTVNVTDEVDEVSVTTNYDINSGGDYIYTNAYENGTNSYIGYDYSYKNGTQNISLTGNNDIYLYTYPNSGSNYTLKQYEVKAYNITTTEKNFLNHYTTTSQFTDYRNDDTPGVATVTNDGIEYNSSDGNFASYYFKSFNSSPNAIDDITISVNVSYISGGSANPRIFLYDSGGKQEYVGSFPTSGLGNHTMSLTNQGVDIASYDEMKVRVERYDGDLRIEDITIQSYNITYVSGTLPANPISTTTQLEEAEGINSNATVSSDTVSLTNNEQYRSKFLNNTDSIDSYMVELHTSNDVTGTVLGVNGSNTLNYSNQIGSSFFVSYDSGSSEGYAYVSNFSYTNIDDYQYVQPSIFSSNEKDFTIQNYSVYGYNFSYTQQFNKSTESELKNGEWNNSTVSFNSDTMVIDSDNNESDYNTTQSLSVSDKSESIVVNITGSNLDKLSVGINGRSSVMTTNNDTSTGNVVLIYSKNTVQNANITLIVKSGNSVEVDSIQTSIRDGSEESVTTVTRNDNRENITYTNETRTEVTT
ncbi:type IV pilin [Methanohalobium sp.]|uniref:type IV pilin n=1 Tax=Methanohalobium sp. TaxID=2837493 RepID=UPI0025FC5E57|nr:type IV pilin [Methanohalobium sp.]